MDAISNPSKIIFLSLLPHFLTKVMIYYPRLFVNLRITIQELKKVKKFTADQEQVARFAKALGHPVRVAILQLLRSQACCYHGDMAQELPVAKSTLSQHLNELKDAGLIQGDITPPTVKYCINIANYDLAKKLLTALLD